MPRLRTPTGDESHCGEGDFFFSFFFELLDGEARETRRSGAARCCLSVPLTPLRSGRHNARALFGRREAGEEEEESPRACVVERESNSGRTISPDPGWRARRGDGDAEEQDRGCAPPASSPSLSRHLVRLFSTTLLSSFSFSLCAL